MARASAAPGENSEAGVGEMGADGSTTTAAWTWWGLLLVASGIARICGAARPPTDAPEMHLFWTLAGVFWVLIGIKSTLRSDARVGRWSWRAAGAICCFNLGVLVAHNLST